MTHSRFRDDDYAHEINMIPLIDVMLVLLVVFLVTAPLMQSTLNIELPRTSANTTASPARHVVVSIGADGRYAWGEQVVTLDTLSDKLTLQASEQADTEVRVKADQTVAFEKVAQVLALAQNSGFSRIAVMTAGASSTPLP